MSAAQLIRDAYRELDDSGSLSRRTQETLQRAGIDLDVLEAANEASKEIEETE